MSECPDCVRLWAEFSEANTSLLTLVEHKDYGKRPDSDLERAIESAIENRQRAKRRILAHQRECHSETEPNSDI